MPTPQGTRPLSVELVSVAERVRDDTLTKLAQLVTPVITQAFFLGGEAKLLLDPEADEDWAAMARRTLDDLNRVKNVIDALTDHLCSEDPPADDDLTDRVARLEQQMVTEVSRIIDAVREIRDDLGGAQ